jgi:hypothetical protein
MLLFTPVSDFHWPFIHAIITNFEILEIYNLKIYDCVQRAETRSSNIHMRFNEHLVKQFN